MRARYSAVARPVPSLYREREGPMRCNHPYTGVATRSSKTRLRTLACYKLLAGRRFKQLSLLFTLLAKTHISPRGLGGRA